MSKLLHSGIRRYLRSYVFLIAVIATVALGLFASYSTRYCQFDDMYIMIEFLIFAVVVSWLIGREVDEGVIRNKIIAGHTKGSIFLSELILATCACVILFLIYAALFALFNGYVFEVLSAGYIVKIFVGFLLLNISMSTIMVVVTCLVPRRAVSGIVNLLLVFAIAYVAYEIDGVLSQPEYITVYDINRNIYIDEPENESDMWSEEPNKGLEANPQYLDGTPRKVCEVLKSILPFGQVLNYMDFLNYYLGYVYYDYYTGEYIKKLPEGLTEEMIEFKPQWADSYENGKNNMIANSIYSVVVILMVSGLGYFIFRKKELK